MKHQNNIHIIDDVNSVHKSEFEVRSYQRAIIKTKINNKIYDIEYGICMWGNESGEYIVDEVWINDRKNAPKFDFNMIKKEITEILFNCEFDHHNPFKIIEQDDED